jgi:hypothetical protein
MTIEAPRSETVMAWVKAERFINSLDYELMAEFFDLEGALADDELELAWRARERLLTVSVELFVLRRGLQWNTEGQRFDHTTLAVEALETVNPILAREVWDHLLLHAPDTIESARAEVARTLSFVEHKLIGIPVTRRDAIHAWADGTRLLRDIAESMGMAGTDDWYLSMTETSRRLGWYDEVLGLLSSESEPTVPAGPQP